MLSPVCFSVTKPFSMFQSTFGDRITSASASAAHVCRRISDVARGAIEQRGDGDAGEKVGHRIFRQHADAERAAEHAAPSASPARATASPSASSASAQQNSSGTSVEMMRRGEHDARQQREGERRPERGARIVELVGDGVDHQRRAEIEDRARRAHAGLAVAADRAGRCDDPRQQRRLREVAEGELARPRPVLRLVEEQIDDRVMQADQSG